MSIKPPNIFPILITLLAHLLLICLGGYFLSPEFTLYPYLASIGLKPYINIIDQHLPVIFFGPLSLPKILTQNPQPLLALFLSLVALTDFLFFHLLKKNKVPNSVFWTALFAISVFIFDGSTLWLETFVVPLILLLFLQEQAFFTGLLSSLIILIRPSLAPAVLFLFIFKKIKPSRSLLAGFLTPFLATLAYLIYHQLLSGFIGLFFNFNASYYSVLAGKLPDLRQLFLIGLIFAPVLTILLSRKKYLSILIILLSFLPACPRFELIHLQPAVALAVFFWSISPRHSTRSPKCSVFSVGLSRLFLVLLILLSIKKIIAANYGNFYLTPETLQISSYLKQQSESQIFILNGSDLIYPLSGKNPAGGFYLPSLPWYYANPDFVYQQLKALKDNQQALIIVNQPVGGFTRPVYQHIIDKYTKIHSVGSYQVYLNNPQKL